MRWMKTSSRPERDLAPLVFGDAQRGDGALQRGGDRLPLTCSIEPNATACSTPGAARSFSASARRSGPLTRQVVSRACSITSATVPMREQLAVGDVGKAMAALRFIHVMGGDEHGEALAGEGVNLLPEIATRLGVDAGGGLIEEQELRAMNQARGEREPLFPAAAQLARELLLPAQQAEPFDALAHRRRAVLHPIHARHEIEILADAQVFVEQNLCVM